MRKCYWLTVEKICAVAARALLWTAEVFGAMANAARAKQNEVRSV